MASEVKRGLIRIASNYGRLLLSVVVTILLVPILLSVIGDAGVGLVLLLGSTVGIAAMFQQIIYRSMVRELGAAFHSGSDDAFRATYQSALAVSVFAALLVAIIFAVLWVLVPLFKVDGMEDAARGMVAARGLATVVLVLTAAPMNMFLVREQMVGFNFWQFVTGNAHSIIAALILLFLTITSPGQGVIIFAWISSGIMIAGALAAAAIQVAQDRRLVPSFARTNSRDVKDIVQTTGWNSAVIVAMNLYTRLDAIIMNIAFGLFGNLTFGIAVLLTGYSRRLTVGMTDGLDAVSARMHAGQQTDSLQRLLYHATRLHGVVAFPAAMGIAILAEPLLQLWVGNRLEDPERSIPATMLMIQILMIGITIRSVSDGWIRILYGTGHVRRYAHLVLAAGLMNPPLAVLAIFVLPRESTIELMGPAIATSVVLLVAHGLLLPRIVARCTNVSYREILRPLIRPAVATLIASAVPLIMVLTIDRWTWPWLIGVCLAYGLVYLLLTLTLTMRRADHEMTRRIILRLSERVTGKRPTGGSPPDPVEGPTGS